MISVSSNKAFIRHEHRFEVYVLQNESLEISLVPDLGAKVISLVNRWTGREWMSCPTGGPKLFRNERADDFAASTLVGWDECLPTIAPCVFKGRSLPDHGEVWNGHHHQALEPSNGSSGALVDSCADNKCGMVSAGAKLDWQVTIQIEPVITTAKSK